MEDRSGGGKKRKSSSRGESPARKAGRKKGRKESAADLLRLAMFMQRPGGTTKEEAAERFQVDKRTMDRDFNIIADLFGDQVSHTTDFDRKKRWKLAKGRLNELQFVAPEDLAALRAAIRLLGQENRTDEATRLGNLEDMIIQAMKTSDRERVFPDLEELDNAQDRVAHALPRPNVSPEVRATLQEAIKAACQVSLDYHNRTAGTFRSLQLHVDGFLHGHRHYLVARAKGYEQNEPRIFSLSNIENVRILEGRIYEAKEGFSLREFAKRSFGIYQEEKPYDVVWRFSPDAAATAQEFHFHPDQQSETEADGSLIVRFQATGYLEMVWHLFMWGDKVEVISPKKVADLIRDHRPSWPSLP